MSETSSSAGMAPSYTGAVPEKETGAYKAAKWAVIILSVLIVLAVIALVVGGLYKLSGKKPAPAMTGRPVGTASFQLPAGATIVSMDSQPGRLILRVRDSGYEEIDIINTENGHLVARIKASLGPAD